MTSATKEAPDWKSSAAVADHEGGGGQGSDASTHEIGL